MKYMHIKFFEDYVKSLKRKEFDFEVSKTSYTRKIRHQGKTIFFNEDGGSDMQALSLINMVRNNAKKFLGSTSFQERDTYIHFSELINKPKSDEVIWKIDIRSAYWNMALKRGIIEEVTNKKLLELFEYEPAEMMKKARLKALGSLATKKTTQIYQKGKLVDEKFSKEKTRELYMDICRDVDALMRDCINENGRAVFYYWDCVFIPDGFEAGVIKYFKDRKYDVSVETTKLEFVTIAGTNWVLSMTDDKAYLVRKESRALIDGLIPIRNPNPMEDE